MTDLTEAQKHTIADLLTGELRRAAAQALAAGVPAAAIRETFEDRRRHLGALAAKGDTMRTKTALQLADGTGWHYGYATKGGGYPIGRCTGHAPHPTEDEARECYGAYVREDTIRLDAHACSWTPCTARPDGRKCPNPTQGVATYGDDGYGQVALCPGHMTVENVIEAAQLAGPAGDAWIS